MDAFVRASTRVQPPWPSGQAKLDIGELVGVTVHFEGRLKSDHALSDLLLHIEEIGRAETLLTERFENSQAKLGRVREERPWEYVGPTKGILLYLHEDCEPLRLEFDRELYVQEWVKTQFAGIDTHIRLIQILRDIGRFFQTLPSTTRESTGKVIIERPWQSTSGVATK